MANSANPDQLASSEANWSGSTLFAKTRYIRVQQDKSKWQESVSQDFQVIQAMKVGKKNVGKMFCL